MNCGLLVNWEIGGSTVFCYKSFPTWPLKEEYAKWQLALFKPWEKSLEENKDGEGKYVSV